MKTALASVDDEHSQPHIRGIMLPSGDVLFSENGSQECPWCQLVDMQGCFMHLTCAKSVIRPTKQPRSNLTSLPLAVSTNASIANKPEHPESLRKPPPDTSGGG